MRRTSPIRKIHPIPFTKEGYEKIKTEYQKLLEDRKDAVYHVKISREMGDLRENGYYKASRAKLSSIDSNLARLSHFIKYAKIIEANSTDTVILGTQVTLTFKEKRVAYTIVGDFEADPSSGKISQNSPLGKALMGKKVGDKAIVKAPSGEIVYTITQIKVE